MTLFEGLTPPYATIVADPPWPYEDGPTGRQRQMGRTEYLPYSRLPVADIAALDIGSLGKVDAHLYLWTTQRFLRSAFDVAETWGFNVGPVLSWCKVPMGHQSGGAFSPTTEFVLVARRNHGPAIAAARKRSGLTVAEVHRAVRGGNPTGLCRMWETGARYPSADDWQRLGEVLGASFDLAGPTLNTASTTWFDWPRGRHSEKPPAFLDLVERVSPGPYVELFARAPRLGWDSWGHGYESGVA